MSTQDWAVFRQDFSGNEFLVERDLTHAEAIALAEHYESKKHHQHYWVDRLPDEPPDYLAMFRESIQSGSTVELAIKVLRNQNASEEQCMNVLVVEKQLEINEARELLQHIKDRQ